MFVQRKCKQEHQPFPQSALNPKQINLDSRLGPIDYNRELEAIAKFSHSRVSLYRSQKSV